MRITLTVAAAAVALVVSLPARAQTAPPAAPPDPVSGNVSAGLFLTAGNKDTTNFNFGYEFKYDPKTRNVVKSSGLVLFGKTDGESTAEQYAISVRDEFSINPRTFVYGEMRYLHDRFKAISYLLSPTGGIGYKLVDTEPTKLSVAAGVGGVWEKDYDVDLQTSGAVTFDERLSHQLSKTAKVGQTFSALWKTSDFGDALYTFGVNVTADLVAKIQLKAELLDTYKNKPSAPALSKNDVALVMAFVYKF